ncbi:hypothetical protein C8J57DRAFT_1397662 [Mycena rebaudengoi]|nr:hypothetical protein C8J57DRAFT_1397662 [Mycena rebaudengoi]
MARRQSIPCRIFVIVTSGVAVIFFFLLALSTAPLESCPQAAAVAKAITFAREKIVQGIATLAFLGAVSILSVFMRGMYDWFTCAGSSPYSKVQAITPAELEAGKANPDSEPEVTALAKIMHIVRFIHSASTLFLSAELCYNRGVLRFDETMLVHVGAALLFVLRGLEVLFFGLLIFLLVGWLMGEDVGLVFGNSERPAASTFSSSESLYARTILDEKAPPTKQNVKQSDKEGIEPFIPASPGAIFPPSPSRPLQPLPMPWGHGPYHPPVQPMGGPIDRRFQVQPQLSHPNIQPHMPVFGNPMSMSMMNWMDRPQPPMMQMQHGQSFPPAYLNMNYNNGIPIHAGWEPRPGFNPSLTPSVQMPHVPGFAMSGMPYDQPQFSPPPVFYGGGERNFERNFGQWFKPEDRTTMNAGPSQGLNHNPISSWAMQGINKFEHDLAQWLNLDDVSMGSMNIAPPPEAIMNAMSPTIRPCSAVDTDINFERDFGQWFNRGADDEENSEDEEEEEYYQDEEYWTDDDDSRPQLIAAQTPTYPARFALADDVEQNPKAASPVAPAFGCMSFVPNTSSSMPNPPPALGTNCDLFSADFIKSVADGLDEFDVGLFHGDGDIDFERDFGQWFNPDDLHEGVGSPKK